MSRSVVLELALAGAIAATNVNAERARGPVVAIVDLRADNEVSFSLTPRDLAALRLDSDSRVTRAVEVEVTVPEIARQYRNAFILNVYHGILPEPSAVGMEYTSRGVMFHRIDSSGPNRLLIPFVDVVRPIGDATVLSEIEYTDLPILISVEPISKALPDNLADAYFQIVARGVYREEGVLKVVIDQTGEESPFTVSVDGDEVAYAADGYIVTPGIHLVEIFSPPGFQYAQNLLVRRGHTAEVVVVIESSMPTVRIEAPEDADVFLDGQRYMPTIHRTVEIPAGEHVVLVQLGDFSISRQFEVKAGENYTVSLFLDIVVEQTR